MQSIQTLLISAVALFGTVVLVCSCLFFKRFTRNKRNASSTVSDENKSEKTKAKVNGQITGITNTAFADGNRDGDIYENDARVYDYAKNDRLTKKKLGQQFNSQDQNNLSPVYADADDTCTRFYFTLERSTAVNTGSARGYEGTLGNKETDDGTYVIAIPDNVYDKPEDGNVEELVTNDKGTSQFYFTLEECYEQNENEELSSPNFTTEQNSHSNDPIHDTSDGSCKNKIRDAVAVEIEDYYNKQDTDENTYVISIPNEVDGLKHKPTKVTDNEIYENQVNTSAQEQDSEETYVVTIPDDMNDSLNLSPKIKSNGYSPHVEIESDIPDGYSRYRGKETGDLTKYSRNSGIDEENGERYSGQSGMYKNVGGRLSQNVITEEDRSGTNEDMYNSDMIYENVSTSLYPSKQGEQSKEILQEESSSGKKEKISEGSCWANKGQKNIGYHDEDTVTQNKFKNMMINQARIKNANVISSDTLATDSNNGLSKNNASHDGEDCDDDIYENWEDNIVGRVKFIPGESGIEPYVNDVNESVDDTYVNESGDELYLNENSHVIEDQDRDSRCKSFYENLTEFRQSLVIQDIRYN